MVPEDLLFLDLGCGTHCLCLFVNYYIYILYIVYMTNRNNLKRHSKHVLCSSSERFCGFIAYQKWCYTKFLLRLRLYDYDWRVKMCALFISLFPVLFPFMFCFPVQSSFASERIVWRAPAGSSIQFTDRRWRWCKQAILRHTEFTPPSSRQPKQQDRRRETGVNVTTWPEMSPEKIFQKHEVSADLCNPNLVDTALLIIRTYGSMYHFSYSMVVW